MWVFCRPKCSSELLRAYPSPPFNGRAHITNQMGEGCLELGHFYPVSAVLFGAVEGLVGGGD